MGKWVSWRECFSICLGIESLALLGALLLPSSSILFSAVDVGSRQHASFIVTPTIVFLSIALTCQLYTLTAIEYFGTATMVDEFGIPLEYANKLYLCAAVGSLIGVPFGSVCADALGGYRSRKSGLLFSAVLTSLVLPLLPFLLAPSSAEVVCIYLGIVLFLHAAAYPVLTGLIITTVRGKEMEASAFMNVVVTVFGYMLGPALSGWIAQDRTINSWRTAMSVLAAVPLFIAIAYFAEAGEKPDDEQTPLLSKEAGSSEPPEENEEHGHAWTGEVGIGMRRVAGGGSAIRTADVFDHLASERL